MTYIGLDIHKKTISYCVKDVSGRVVAEGQILSTRQGLDAWMATLTRPWTVAMEATMFTGWIYDYLRPYAAAVKVAHPLMLRAIAVAKKKNDRIDAGKIADCLRCDFLPECYMAPMEIRQRRRTLRYRKLLVRQNVQLKNKIAQMLMEAGVSYNKDKLHQQGYFHQVLPKNTEIEPSLWPLLTLCRQMIERTQKTERALLRSLERDPFLAARVERLMTIPAIGHVTALTWVLEVGEVERFHSVKQVISYCGLCSAENSSAGSAKRMPISKQRNRHLQTVLLEAAHLAPRLNPELAVLYERETAQSNRNQAAIAVARKLAAYLLAIDRGDRPFVKREVQTTAAA
jgi:transposase